MFKLFQALVLFGALQTNIYAQSWSEWSVSADYYSGVFWAHRKNMYQMEAFTKGLDLGVYRSSKGLRNDWGQFYRYPDVGLNLLYLDLGMSDLNGKVFGLLPFVEFRLKQGEKHQLNFKMATGLGWATSPWNLTENNLNKAFGSHLNGNMRVQFAGRILVTQHLALRYGAGITHFSNGNFKLPNLGINNVELSVGLAWQKHETLVHPKINKKLEKTYFKEIRIFGGSKETDLVNNMRTYPLGISFRQGQNASAKSDWMIGFDYFFDQSYTQTLEKSFKNQSEMGLALGHELKLGKFGFLTEIGFYAWVPNSVKGRLYKRLGFRYQVLPQWYIQGILKTHFARADYFEWGIGYRFLR